MSDTIELLEAIGRDASLRHATSEELTDVLRQAKASDALTAAVASGDRSPLVIEFGPNANQAPQVTQAPGHLEEEPDSEDDNTPAPSAPDGEAPPADTSTR